MLGRIRSYYTRFGRCRNGLTGRNNVKEPPKTKPQPLPLNTQPMENVDEDIQSVLNTLVSRARAALTHLQDHEGEVLEAGRTPDQAYRSYWITQMSEEMVNAPSSNWYGPC
jgi:predicted secreted protein